MGRHVGGELQSLIVESVQRGIITRGELDAHIARLDAAVTPSAKQAEARRFMAMIAERTRERCGPPAAKRQRRVNPSAN